ncbi:MAG: LysE family translocator [Hyphomonas sp.]
MDPVTALFSFSVAALLLTLTPGLDTALVLRTAAVEGPRRGMIAGAGITLGVLIWGIAAAAGLGSLAALSPLAYQALRIAGALYVLWLGGQMIWSAYQTLSHEKAAQKETAETARQPNWFLRGLTTNLLNPKVGLFYASFLPQFLPKGHSGPAGLIAFGAGLALIHCAFGLIFFALITGAASRASRFLARPGVRGGIEGVTGLVLCAAALLLLVAH